MTAEQELLTIKDICALTGKHYMTVYGWIQKGKLPAKKVGSEYFVFRPTFNRIFGAEESK